MVSRKRAEVPNRHLPCERASILDVLSGTGLTGREMVESINLIDRYVRGTALELLGLLNARSGEAQAQWWPAHASFIATPPDPSKYRMISQVFTTGKLGPPPGPLEFGLARVLDGLEALVRQRTSAAR